MICPNCSASMNNYFLSGSNLDHGCFNCGCIVDRESGLIVMYDDQRTSPWELITGRHRREVASEAQWAIENSKVPCSLCGCRVLQTTVNATDGLCGICYKELRKEKQKKQEDWIRFKEELRRQGHQQRKDRLESTGSKKLKHIIFLGLSVLGLSLSIWFLFISGISGELLRDKIIIIFFISLFASIPFIQYIEFRSQKKEDIYILSRWRKIDALYSQREYPVALEECNKLAQDALFIKFRQLPSGSTIKQPLITYGEFMELMEYISTIYSECNNVKGMEQMNKIMELWSESCLLQKSHKDLIAKGERKVYYLKVEGRYISFYMEEVQKHVGELEEQVIKILRSLPSVIV